MKAITVKFMALIIILLLSAVVSRAKAWRGIIPLKSTRADVERLLGKPNELGRYQYEDERAYIYYAEGSCDKGDNRCECLVSQDTVLNISVTLEVEMRFSILNINKSKYEKTIYPEDPNLAVYSNDEEGIIYDVSESDDDVTHIQYLPSAKDCEEIVKAKSGNATARITTHSTRRLDSILFMLRPRVGD